MSAVARRHGGGEQLLVLWTWLLEGYVPVAHIVADVDEAEAPASRDATDTRSGDAPRGRQQHPRATAA